MFKRKKVQCLCCGCLTMDERSGFGICPVCYWEDDAFITFRNDKIYVLSTGDETYETVSEELLNVPSGANHGLTLREGRENYQKFGACEESMIEYVRKPKKRELPDNKNRRKK